MSKAKNLLGKRFNHLTVVKRLPNDSEGNTFWLCRCDCGKEKTFRGSDLQRKPPRSCGCDEYKYKPHFRDLTGKTFGRLTVISRAESTKSGNLRWNCKCECGGTTIATSFNLIKGISKSCGCLARENSSKRSKIHGDAKHGKVCRLYRIWVDMNRRCEKENRKTTERYYNRGIRVCEEWKDSYENFKSWSLKNGYSENLSLDRIDNDGNYDPKNCRWATQQQQMRNTSSNVLLEYNEDKFCIAEWAERLKVKYSTLHSFVTKGNKLKGEAMNDRFKIFVEKRREKK